MNASVLLSYHLCVAGLLYFALYRVKIMFGAWRACRHPLPAPAPLRGPAPQVCIQCPCYNEPLVIKGLLEAVTAIRWPGPLEIQILDDSTDATSEIISRWLLENPASGVYVRHLFRSNRAGYKAGALNEGLKHTDAPFIAIFDADFRPQPDFLEQLMPYFGDPKVGVVQARWEFRNRHASLLTWFQAMILDIHFVLEQPARCHARRFFNFNGTAGIWRRQAMDDGGGWSADTVTEDLDLSYRSQLAGWRFIYTPHYAVESELPENITGFKSQQRRWTKGGLQVARRLLGPLLCSRQPFAVKLEGFCHLTIGAINPILAGYCLTQLPYIATLDLTRLSPLDIASGLAVLLGTVVSIFSFWFAQKIRTTAGPGDAALVVLRAPLLMLFSLGMAVTYTAAFVEGLLARHAGEFIRTPKGGAHVQKQGLLKQLSGRGLLNAVAGAEIAAGCIAGLCALYFAAEHHPIGVVGAAVLAAAFLIMGISSVADAIGWEWPRRAAPGPLTGALNVSHQPAEPTAVG